MRVVIQRVTAAEVAVDGAVVGRIGRGLVALVGVQGEDTSADVEYVANKLATVRLFDDETGKMNRSVTDVSGEILVVSQFTLLGDCRKGRRPSFDRAAPPDAARLLYETLLSRLRDSGVTVAAGRFREHMTVQLVNDGPVTVLLDSKKCF